MVITTLTDLNNLITNGTGAERLAFKAIIVGGLNAQDLADIITSSNRIDKEALAVLVVQAQGFLNDTNQIAAQAQLVIDLGIAQTWFDDNIVSTLTWSNAQSNPIQLANSVLDRVTLQALTETDLFRKTIINNEIKTITARIRSIKPEL